MFQGVPGTTLRGREGACSAGWSIGRAASLATLQRAPRDAGGTLSPVDTPGCPRCVAERRARRVGVGAKVVAGVATVVVARPLSIAMYLAVGLLAYGPRHYPVPRVLRSQNETIGWTVIVSALACLAIFLGAVADRFTRRASTPLPPPAADPVAHYREGPPTECPRHPFAR